LGFTDAVLVSHYPPPQKLETQSSKRQSAWMNWTIPIERLVRQGKVVLDSSTDSIVPPEGMAHASAITVSE